jgi:hypothetical protein
MKKMVICLMVLSLMATVLVATPALANYRHYRPYGNYNFWPGVAAGVGAAILFGSILSQPRYVYPPPPTAYYPPPPPPEEPYYERWVPGHWEVQVGPYGDRVRIWVPGYWQR